MNTRLMEQVLDQARRRRASKRYHALAVPGTRWRNGMSISPMEQAVLRAVGRVVEDTFGEPKMHHQVWTWKAEDHFALLGHPLSSFAGAAARTMRKGLTVSGEYNRNGVICLTDTGLAEFQRLEKEVVS